MKLMNNSTDSLQGIVSGEGPRITFWEGKDAKERLEEFNKTADEIYGRASRFIKVLEYNPHSEIVSGSNVFAVAHADSLFKSEGVRVVTLADLKKATGYLNSKEITFQDAGLVLEVLHSTTNTYLER